MLGKVLLLEDIHPIAKEKFQEGGFEVESLKHSPSEKELYNRIKDVSILGIRSKTNISEEFLNYAGNLLALGAYCIGTNQINIPECSKRGVCVFNDPISNTRSVAELAMGEIIMLLRGIFNKSISLHKGIWNKSSENSVEVRGKNLGIIGYGKIGSQLSTIAESLGMNVYYYDLQRKVNYGNAKKCNSLEDLFGISDIVTLHVDGNKNNRGFFGKREFEMMKDKSYFLNLSRGFVVDEKALAEYLDKGKILGAAIDVFETEPSSNNNLFKSVLQNKKNVILTPHIGGNTLEAQKDIAMSVSDNLLSFYIKGDSASSLNFPNPDYKGDFNQNRVRFSHVHKNIPGILAQITNTISSYNLNISNQKLDTKGDLGYVIGEIEGNVPSQLLKKLENVNGTIRFRILY